MEMTETEGRPFVWRFWRFGWRKSTRLEYMIYVQTKDDSKEELWRRLKRNLWLRVAVVNTMGRSPYAVRDEG